MAASPESGFYVAPFAIDGEHIGLEFRSTAALSSKWLRIARDFLCTHGAVFDTCWGGGLAHIRTKFTSAAGAALATFFVRGEIAASLVLLSGKGPEAEREVLEMFVTSLRKTIWAQASTSVSQPFSELLSMKERPLLAVVVWPESALSDLDHEVIRDLSVHLAGAFFSEGS